MEVVIDRPSGRLAAVTAVAARAEQWIVPLELLLARRLTLAALADVVPCYPSRLELLKRIADRCLADREARYGPGLRGETRAGGQSGCGAANGHSCGVNGRIAFVRAYHTLSTGVAGCKSSTPAVMRLSRNPKSFRDRVGCWSLRTALASICRTRSRVTEKILPTSSRV